MRIALLLGTLVLVGLSSSASAQPGQNDPNCNSCLQTIRTAVTQNGQQIAQVQQGVTQSQQSLTQVQASIAQVQQGVAQANQKLSQIVGNPPAPPQPVPAPVMKKSAVVIEFGSGAIKPAKPSSAGSGEPAANLAASEYCAAKIKYASGVALSFNVLPTGSGNRAEVVRLVCFD